MKIFPDRSKGIGITYLVFLIIPAVFLLELPSRQDMVMGSVMLIIFGIVYIYSYQPGKQIIAFVLENILISAMIILLSPGYTWMITYPATLMASYYSHSKKKVILSGIILVGWTLGMNFLWAAINHTTLVTDQYNLLLLAIYLIMVASMIGVLAQVKMIKTNHQLQQALGEVERLTKIAERDRISQDLHDVMGHELSLIALKAQVAKRFIDKDIARTKREIDEIELAARESLTKVRRYVANMRKVDFDEEWEFARSALKTAEIECEFVNEASIPADDINQVLAMCLREAVTNIIRHSGAMHALVKRCDDQKKSYLLIADDGCGLRDSWIEKKSNGYGLAGMLSRMAEINGKLLIWSNGTWLTKDMIVDALYPEITPFIQGTLLCFVAFQSS